MDAKQFTGDDNRDELATPPAEDTRCPDCGEDVTECSKACGCKACRERDDREPPEPDPDRAAEMHARRTDPTHPANVEMQRLKR